MLKHITQLLRFTTSLAQQPLHPTNITRYHNHFRVDQYHKQFSDPQQLSTWIEQQKTLYNSHKKQWLPVYKYYRYKCSERKDTRQNSMSQKYHNYEYRTQVGWYKEKQYTKIERKTINSPEDYICVLDVMNYSIIRSYYQSFQLQKTVFSASHRFLAFGYDLHNDENLRWMIKDMEKNRIYAVKGWENNELPFVDDVVWRGDEGLYYVKTKDHRPNQLWYVELSSGQSSCLFVEEDPEYHLSIHLTKDEQYLICQSLASDHNKVHKINLQENHRKLSPLNNYSHKIFVEHCEEGFVTWHDAQNHYITLNDNTIHTCPPNQTITDIDVIHDHIIVYSQDITTPKLTIIKIKENVCTRVQLPYNFGSISPGINKQYRTSTVQFYMNNLFTFEEGYEYDITTKKIHLKEEFITSGPKFPKHKFLVQQHQVAAVDGETIPLTVVVPKKNKGVQNKMILHSYGCYGLSYEIQFNHAYMVALEEGWSIAYAHIRGGRENGKSWHDDAKQNRTSTWNDLEDCLAYLFKEQYTHPNILILHSHSAGSIPVWNLINRNPHLCKAAILNYPFMDPLTMLMDPTLPLTNSDHREFGNPIQDTQKYHEICSYSPYQTIKPQKYPFLYLTCAMNDYRCPAWQVAKFVTRLKRLMKKNERYEVMGEEGVLVRVDEGSHEGAASASEGLDHVSEMLSVMDWLIEKGSHDVNVQS